jgi:glycosyltransferase involved in cell wall biosynthesis
VFIHREATPVGPPIIEFIIARLFGKKIVYDFDDAIWLPNTSSQNKLIARLRWPGKVRHICRWSWKVSGGNDFLADFAKKCNSSVVVNPTTIDTQYHIPRKSKNKELIIGWTGTHSTSKYLRIVTKALRKLSTTHDFGLHVISNQKPTFDLGSYTFVKWSSENEIEELNKFDIGIMPLEDSLWEEGKCGFKALQYMALEIPTIASNVGANRQIIDHGINGYLCKTEKDWLKYLKLLLESDALRKKIGIEGRKKVHRHYSLDSNKDLFLSLFT